MSKKEFSIWASALRTYYPKENLLQNAQAVELWYHHLKDIDYKIAHYALEKWVDKNKWAPTIADVREGAKMVYWEALETCEQGSVKFLEIYNTIRGFDDRGKEQIKLLGVNE